MDLWVAFLFQLSHPISYNTETMRKINCDEAKKFDLVDYLAAASIASIVYLLVNNLYISV
jgi:hypothetical protein